MRRPLLALLAALVAALVLAVPARAVDTAGLKQVLGTLQGRLGPSAGAYVVDLSTGRTLFAQREDVPLAPASNEKLFTTATALLRFGADGRLTTSLRGTVQDGVVRGDLYLVGGGDPTLGDVGLAQLAAQVQALGITHITGAVVGDGSFFDALRGGPSTGYRADFWLGGSLGGLVWAHGRTADGSTARAAARRFATYLEDAGITYGRRPRAGTVPTVAAALPPLTTYASPPMATIAQLTNVPSENFYAETLVKALGATFGGAGSTTAGLDVVRDELLARMDLHPRLVDGSGLSYANRTTARQLGLLLQTMATHELAMPWVASLPVMGRTGTVARRLRGSTAQDACRAKTGTLTGVSALSGYCTTAGGRPVVFSFLENRVCTSCAKALEDRMVGAIARWSAPLAAAAGRRP